MRASMPAAMPTAMRTTLLALTTAIVLTLGATSAPAAPTSLEAREFLAASRAPLAAFKSTLKTFRTSFQATLRQQIEGIPNEVATPQDIVSAATVAWTGLHVQLGTEPLSGVRRSLDQELADILADSGVTFAPGLVVGDGGALDKVNAKILAEYEKTIAACAAITRRELGRVVAGVPDMRLQLRTFPLAGGEFEAVAGTVSGNAVSAFADFAPCMLVGCGVPSGADGNAAFGILGRADGSVPISMNLYSGDSSFLATIATGLTATSNRTVAFTFTRTFPGVPHGNAYIEVFRPSTGWTRSIGY
jgi:hypothetical protein